MNYKKYHGLNQTDYQQLDAGSQNVLHLVAVMKDKVLAKEGRSSKLYRQYESLISKFKIYGMTGFLNPKVSRWYVTFKLDFCHGIGRQKTAE